MLSLFIYFYCTALIQWSEGLVRNGTCSNPICPFLSPSLHIQDDAGQLLGAQGPGNLSERGRRLLSGLGCIWVHRFTGKTPGPFPLQLLPHQLPTSLCAQVREGLTWPLNVYKSLFYAFIFICWSRVCIVAGGCFFCLLVDEQNKKTW